MVALKEEKIFQRSLGYGLLPQTHKTEQEQWKISLHLIHE